MNRTAVAWRSVARALPVLIVAGVLLLAMFLGRRASMLYLALMVGGAGFLVLLQNPGLGLVALAALSFTVPFTIGTGTAVSLTPPVFLIAATAAAWLLVNLYKHSLRLPSSRPALPLVLFLGSGLISLLAGRSYWDPLVPQPGNLLLVQLAQWGIFALSALIFLLAGDLGSRKRWLEAATWTFLAVGSVVVLEFYLAPLRRLLGWSAGTMASRSLFWVWLGALATGQLLFNRRLTGWARGWLVALLAGAAFVLWFPQRTWSSGWVPFTVAAIGVAWLWVWRRNRAVGLVLGVGLLALAVALFPTLFEHAGGERELEMSWGGRQALYQAVLDLVAEHPILGLGPAAYRHYAHMQWLSLGVGRALYIRPNVSSHNNYIDVYAQQGLVGLGLFLWFVVEVGWLGGRLAGRFEGNFEDGYVQGAVGGFVATLLAMMLADWFLPFVYNIGFPGFRTSALAWMFLGGLLALDEVSRREGEEAGWSEGQR